MKLKLRDRIKRYIRNWGISEPSEGFRQWMNSWGEGWFGSSSASGESVNERSAMGLAAYFACIRNISEDIAKLPLPVFRKLEPRGRRALPNHPLFGVLNDEFNPEMSAMSGRQTLMAHALGYSGGYAEIVRDGAGRVVELWPLDPTTVSLNRNRFTRQLFYIVQGIELRYDQVFHVHGLGYDGLTGYCLAQVLKDPLGNAIAAQKFAGAFFGNGTATSGVIEVEDAMEEPAFKHLRESFAERHGGARNAHKPVILEQGAKFKPTSTDPQHSQMLEVLQHGTEEVCRLFRMPPHKIQHLLRATFTNIEMQALEYVTDCLLGPCVNWEQEIGRKLLLPRERQSVFVKHNLDMLLRGDTTARTAYYRERFNVGSLSPNDIREKEDENPIPGGDVYFVNSTLIPLEMAAKGEHLKAKQAEQQQKQPAAEKAPQNHSEREHKRDLLARVTAAHTRAIEDALSGVLRIEHDKRQRAAKRIDIGDWKREFYGELHQKHVAERLKPVLQSAQASLAAILEAGAHD